MLRFGARFGVPSRTIGGVELSPHQYSDYLATAGLATRNALLPYTASPEYRTLADAERLKDVARIKNESRRAARGAILGGRR